MTYELISVASSTALTGQAISATTDNLAGFSPIYVLLIGILLAFFIIDRIIQFFRPRSATTPTAGYGSATEGHLRDSVDWEKLEEMEGQYHGEPY